MKYVLLLALALVLGNAKGQTENPVLQGNEKILSRELVIGVPKATEKTFGFFVETVSQIAGVKYINYCSQHNLFLLTYDPKRYPDDQSVINTIQESGVSMPMFIKEGTFKEIMQMCEQKN